MKQFIFLLSLFAATIMYGQADFSGNWKLNSEKSQFNDVPGAPVAAKLIVEQKNVGKASYFLINLKITPQLSGEYLNFLQSHSDINTELLIGIFNGKNIVREIKTGITAQQIATQRAPFDISIPRDLPLRNYEIRLGIKTKNYLTTHNSETIHVE